jgi:pimeloyl-ACP methyl ester carboxylesterase
MTRLPFSFLVATCIRTGVGQVKVGRMEERFEIATPLGDIWMWGRDTGKPIALVITGAFADFEIYDRLQLVLPQFDVLRTHLPGNHSPALAETSIAAMSGAISEALTSRFAGRSMVTLGFSTGALVAMGVAAPGLKALLLVEPFLRTAHVWPFRGMVEDHRSAEQQTFLWNVLGVRDGEAEQRDYRHLARGLGVPGHVLLGGIPLVPRRPLPNLPSLVDEEDRATLRAQPLLNLTEVPGAGHNVAAQNIPAFRALLAPVCRSVVPDAVLR